MAVLIGAPFARGATCPVIRDPAPASATATGWPQAAPDVPLAAWRGYLAAQAAFKARDYAQARKLYEASFAENPGFLSPLYGLVSVAVRQDDLAKATSHMARLLRLGFVPWHRESTTDIDLARLWASGDQTVLSANTTAAAAAWGAKVLPGVLLLSRLSAPLQLAPEDGPLLLRPAQEVVSWNPLTGRYHQVTSEGGRVIGFLRAPGGGDLVYVTAEKVRREQGRLVAFEGVAVHWLRLRDMRLVSSRLGASDSRWIKVALSFAKAGPRAFGWGGAGGHAAVELTREAWQPLPWPRTPVGEVTLTPGAADVARRRETSVCKFDLRSTQVQGVPTVKALPAHGTPAALPTKYGLGLATLPLPEKTNPVQKF